MTNRARLAGSRSQALRIWVVDDGAMAAHLSLVCRLAGYRPVKTRPDVILLNLGSRARTLLTVRGKAAPAKPVVVLAPLVDLSPDFAWLQPSSVLPLPFSPQAVVDALGACAPERKHTPLRDRLVRLATRAGVPEEIAPLNSGGPRWLPGEVLETAALAIRGTLAIARLGPLSRASRVMLADVWMGLGLEIAEQTRGRGDPAKAVSSAARVRDLLRRAVGTELSPAALTEPLENLAAECAQWLLEGILLGEQSRSEQYQATASWLVSEITRAQEEVSRHLAAELHDEVVQSVAHLALEADLVLTRAPAADSVREDLQALAALAREVSRRVRTIASELHPPIPGDLGLGPAVAWLATRLRSRTTLRLDLKLPEQLPKLSERQEIATFRVVQEALANVEKHAGASEVQISLGTDGSELWLEVADNGKGFAPQMETRWDGQPSLGIAGMKYRAQLLGGKLSIASSSRGTRVSLRLPLEYHVQAIRARPRFESDAGKSAD